MYINLIVHAHLWIYCELLHHIVHITTYLLNFWKSSSNNCDRDCKITSSKTERLMVWIGRLDTNKSKCTIPKIWCPPKPEPTYQIIGCHNTTSFRREHQWIILKIIYTSVINHSYSISKEACVWVLVNYHWILGIGSYSVSSGSLVRA